jgi:hypothetical protein
MAEPPTELERKAAYFEAVEEQGDVARARIQAAVTERDLQRWRRDESPILPGNANFAQVEIGLLNIKKAKLRRKVDQIIEAVDDEGFPRYPSQIMALARLQLDELKPPAQQVNHNVQGSVGVQHRHQHVIEAMPDEMLEDFIRTGKSSIAMDRIAEATWEKERK